MVETCYVHERVTSAETRTNDVVGRSVHFLVAAFLPHYFWEAKYWVETSTFLRGCPRAATPGNNKEEKALPPRDGLSQKTDHYTTQIMEFARTTWPPRPLGVCSSPSWERISIACASFSDLFGVACHGSAPLVRGVLVCACRSSPWSTS